MIRLKANERRRCHFCLTPMNPHRVTEFWAKPARSHQSVMLLGDRLHKLPRRRISICSECAPFVRRLGRYGRLYLEVTLTNVQGERVTETIPFTVRRRPRVR